MDDIKLLHNLHIIPRLSIAINSQQATVSLAGDNLSALACASGPDVIMLCYTSSLLLEVENCDSVRDVDTFKISINPYCEVVLTMTQYKLLIPLLKLKEATWALNSYYYRHPEGIYLGSQ